MILAIDAKILAGIVQGELKTTANPGFTEVVTDSRQLKPGCLFVALQGPRFDGHDYVAEARVKGASLALVSDWVDDPLPQVKVESTLLALGQLAAWNRQAFKQPLIGVTGNSGKTSVKELLAACLAESWGSVAATRGNLNNNIGLPLTLLELQATDQAAVVEMGANHLGEIAYLAGLAQPDVAIITNVTGAHLGEFGSLEAIAKAKGELLEQLDAEKVAILNAEDRFYTYWQGLVKGNALSFGLHQGDIHAQQLHLDSSGNSSFVAVTPWGQQAFQLQLPGLHNVANALAVIAAAGYLGLSLARLAEVMQKQQPVVGRMQRVKGYADCLIFDDSYNASPGAVKSAIDLLARLPGERLLVLGALAELGAASEQVHLELGAYARQQGLDGCYVLAGDAAVAAQGFGQGAEVLPDLASLAACLKQRLTAESCVLVKGSRSAGMDRLVDLLRVGSTVV